MTISRPIADMSRRQPPPLQRRYVTIPSRRQHVAAGRQQRYAADQHETIELNFPPQQ